MWEEFIHKAYISISFHGNHQSIVAAGKNAAEAFMLSAEGQGLFWYFVNSERIIKKLSQTFLDILVVILIFIILFFHPWIYVFLLLFHIFLYFS